MLKTALRKLVSHSIRRLGTSPDGALWFNQVVMRTVGPRALNLGGGRRFAAFGWLNLDEVISPATPTPFRFTPTCTFPVADQSVDTVYTSHALEHLPTPTVERALAETHRVLKPQGRLVIKIPDFDQILESWRRDDASYFRDELWNFPAVTPTWPSRGLDDCLDYRAAVIFCGIWNDAFGNQFAEQRQAPDRHAYHGPPVVSKDYLHALLNECTPSQISARLVAKVMENEHDYYFNHQNAWSRAELKDLLVTFGFEPMSFDPAMIVAACGDIPGIAEMAQQSTYCLAKKA